MSRLDVYAELAPERLAGALAEATNEITRRTPAPRDLPFFGLDHPEGCGGNLLDRLSELGIFRFYERVLDLGRGLGGPGRWLARRRGCEIVSVAERLDFARASRLLVRRSYLESAVGIVSAPFARIPAADASFTHAWSVESLGEAAEKPAIFAEIHRVVRPGGHVALQEWLPAARSRQEGEDSVDAYTGGLRAAGFVRPRASEVTDLRERDSAITEILRERVEALAGDPSTLAGPAWEAESARQAARARAIAEGRLVLVQVFAQKPS